MEKSTYRRLHGSRRTSGHRHGHTTCQRRVQLGYRLCALYHLIALRGLRRGEATGLPWVNVNLEDGEVIIDTQIVQLGWVTQTTSPKAGSEGTLALDALTT